MNNSEYLIEKLEKIVVDLKHHRLSEEKRQHLASLLLNFYRSKHITDRDLERYLFLGWYIYENLS